MSKMRNNRLLPLLLIVIGGALIAVGVFARAEHFTVLRKAIYVCLECIGIG